MDEKKLCRYVAFYGGKQIEVEADSLYSARIRAIAQLKVPKSKQGLLAVMCAERDGMPIIHDPAELG
jgi:hypothetical protein